MASFYLNALEVFDMEEEQMSRGAWERERTSELNSKTVADLASKVAALEFDLKAKRTELDAVKGQLPSEGSVVLSKADAEKWASYSALGKPDDLKTAMTERDSFRSDLSGRDRRDSNRTAADAAGYRPGVLEKLLPADAVTSVREVTVDGKAVRTAFVKIGENERPLSEWASVEHADFMPSLALSTPPAGPPAASWVPQPAATPPSPEGTSASPWGAFMANRDTQNTTAFKK